MAAAVIGRNAEMAEVNRLLAGLGNDAPLMLVEGDAGIGKTTILQASADMAARLGIRVLSCAGWSSEMGLAYTGLEDLLGALGDAELASLPPPQRDALDAVLFRAEPAGGEVDSRAVGTATLSVLRELGRAGGVLIVVDDAQWLDRPSARVVGYVARRLPPGVGLIASCRRGEADGWLGGTRRSATEVRRLEPLSDREIERLLRERAPTVERGPRRRIVDVAGGNPFYALELARASHGRRPDEAFPTSLAAVIDARLSSVSPAVQELLLTLAALADPTLPLLEEAIDGDALARVEEAEERGVVVLEGARVRFAHPLLAQAVYSRARAGERRAIHRRLSVVVASAEERARHLALGGGGRDAIPALEQAARRVRSRGAPDAAADLLELALEVGGNEELRVRAAECHLDVGDVGRARSLLEAALAALPPGEMRVRALLLLAEVRYKDDSFLEARRLLEAALDDRAASDGLRARVELGLAFVRSNLGSSDPDVLARSALRRARRLDDPALLAQAMAVSVMLGFAAGRGIDERRLAEAVELEASDVRIGVELLPSLIAAWLFLWTGRFDEVEAVLQKLSARHADRGEEHAIAFMHGYVRIFFDCWAGRAASEATAMEANLDRLFALDTTMGRGLALSSRALVDAYAGRVDTARSAADEALALFERAGCVNLGGPPLAALGFLELSIGEYEAAAKRLVPFAFRAATEGMPEPTAGGALLSGDAAEALIALSRLNEAEVIVGWLEERGAALGRAWAIAVGARCRALLFAAQGDLDAAELALGRAFVAHERLPMPVERARTLLAHGRLQRRRRRRLAAKAALTEAAAIFEQAGAPRWAEQASGELARLGLNRGAPDRLTASEERVASLAASGLTNQAVAAILSVSPKTVEAQLANAYRKLGIHTRAELGARMAPRAQT